MVEVVISSELMQCFRHCCREQRQLSVARKPGVALLHGMCNLQDFAGIIDRGVVRYI
jgi:hypothetical protein